MVAHAIGFTGLAGSVVRLARALLRRQFGPGVRPTAAQLLPKSNKRKLRDELLSVGSPARQETMKNWNHTQNRSPVAALASLFVLLAACSSTSTNFTSTWSAPDAQPVAANGMRIAAVFINENEGVRRVGEDALATEITRSGGIGVVSYSIMPDNPQDREAAKQKLAEAGIDAVISMRVISHDQVLSFTPDYWVGSPYRTSLWGYWSYGWGSVYAPGYLSAETLVGVETLLYSIEQDKLLWAGVSETFTSKTVRSAIKSVAKKAVKRMNESNVLVR
jgi:hypothetical protein